MFDLNRLSFPELNDVRKTVLSALIEVSNREDAAKILKVGAKGTQEILAQRDILNAACAPAREVYTGVLYEAAKLHQDDDVLIFSGLFGVTTGEDLIPTYRLSMNVSLPGIGPLKSFWRKQLAGWTPDDGFAGDCEPFSQTKGMNVTENEAGNKPAMNATDSKNVTVDLRSGLYRVTKPNSASSRDQWWDIRIANSENKTISHMAKHYRGLLTRALLDSPNQPIDDVARTLGTVSVEAKDNIYHLTLVPTGL